MENKIHYSDWQRFPYVRLACEQKVYTTTEHLLNNEIYLLKDKQYTIDHKKVTCDDCAGAIKIWRTIK